MSYEHEAVAPAREKTKDVLLEGPLSLHESNKLMDIIPLVSTEFNRCDQRLINQFMAELFVNGVTIHDLASFVRLKESNSFGALSFFMRKIISGFASLNKKEETHVSK